MTNWELGVLLVIGACAFAMLLKNWAESRPEFEGTDWAKEAGLLETPPPYLHRPWHSRVAEFLLFVTVCACGFVIVTSTIAVAQLLAAVALVLLIACWFRNN